MMHKKNQNIEKWFLQLPRERFPDSMDCVANYRVIRNAMDEQFHSEIKAMVIQFIPEIYLNDHGPKHIKKVIEKASEIINIEDEILTPYETFFLLVAIQIHDAGHLINGRKEHELNARRIINSFGNETINSVEKKFVSSIAKTHSGKDDPIGKLNNDQFVSNQPIRLKRIAAILRLADELADDATRTSMFLLENEKIPHKSLIFHEYSSCLDSCIAICETNQIKMNFYLKEELLPKTFLLGDEKTFLIDEIYNRTIKTYLECLYCNRFLPEKYRYSCIDVDIEILTENVNIIPKSIAFRITENGYPDFSKKSIFEICGSELKSSNGVFLDGKYFCDQINKVPEQ